MTKPLSPERASEIIGDIYDCVLAPAKWDLALARICDELELANAVLGVIRLPTGIQILHSAVGVPADWLAAAPTYDEEIVAIWGGAQRIQAYPLDEPVIQSKVAGRAEMEANRWFRERVKPRGIIDAVAFGIVRETNTLGNVVFGRHGSYGRIDDGVMNGLRLLAPHFRRAITIGDLFDMKAIEAAAFRATLDAVSFGVVIVDENLHILHANAASEAMLAEGSSLRVQQGALSLQHGPAESVLRDAVERAARDEATIGQKGIGVQMRGAGGEALVMHVLPLHSGATRPGLVARAVAAIFIAPAARPLHMPIDALALLYDLTPAETRVLELICDGAAPDQIAAQLGLARSTIRTHLNHIFDKTGCRRQAELIALAARFSL